MAVGSHTFTKTSSIVFLQGDSYPFEINRRRVQASEETAGGVLYVQDRDQEIVTYTLTFERISKVDRDLFTSIWRFETRGSAFTLGWNDLDDVNHIVRIMNNPLVFQEVGNDGSGPLFNFTLILREEL